MSEDRPLHVRVAEALGWTDLDDSGDGWTGTMPPTATKAKYIGVTVPKYGQNWCSTGPFLERFELSLEFDRGAQDDYPWVAVSSDARGESTRPCEAIAFAVLSLHKQGKLKAA